MLGLELSSGLSKIGILEHRNYANGLGFFPRSENLPVRIILTPWTEWSHGRSMMDLIQWTTNPSHPHLLRYFRCFVGVSEVSLIHRCVEDFSVEGLFQVYASRNIKRDEKDWTASICNSRFIFIHGWESFQKFWIETFFRSVLHILCFPESYKNPWNWVFTW